MKPMKKFFLVGQSGSSKSEVCKLLSERGISNLETLDLDDRLTEVAGVERPHDMPKKNAQAMVELDKWYLIEVAKRLIYERCRSGWGKTLLVDVGSGLLGPLEPMLAASAMLHLKMSSGAAYSWKAQKHPDLYPAEGYLKFENEDLQECRQNLYLIAETIPCDGLHPKDIADLVQGAIGL